MSTTMLLYVGIFVFVMMVVGLVLTVREFLHGEPLRQDKEARAGSSQPEAREDHARKAA